MEKRNHNISLGHNQFISRNGTVIERSYLYLKPDLMRLLREKASIAGYDNFSLFIESKLNEKS
jgi:hypothetical protein